MVSTATEGVRHFHAKAPGQLCTKFRNTKEGSTQTKNKSTPKIAVTHGFPNGTVGFLGGPITSSQSVWKPRGSAHVDSHELPHRSPHMLGPVVPILTGYPPKHGWWDKSTIEVGKGRNQKCLD